AGAHSAAPPSSSVTSLGGPGPRATVGGAAATATAAAVPAAAAPPPPAPLRAPVAAAGPLPDVHRLLEGWDEVVEAVREAGKGVLATALHAASPVAVNAQGAVLVEFDEPNDIYERAFETGKDALLAALQRLFGAAVSRVALRRNDRAAAASAPRERLTSESVKAERLALLRRKDPVLDAAVEALDLDLVE
ncbi:MAG TPA: hypothetical protein VFJ74_06910, partial [Gemmatimonadaceae bacterium]|nr:hypothetical protein [Gemmatimonadaceae bacterium]